MSDFYEKNDRNIYNTSSEVERTYKETKYQDEIAGILKTSQNDARRKAILIAKRKKARRKRIIVRLSIVLIALILALVLIISGIVSAVRGVLGLFASSETGESIEELIARADVAAASYDYDKAVDIIKSFGKNYEKKKDLKQAIIKYQSGKSKLVKYADTEKITHLSFRTLIFDTKKAFDGDENEYNYNRTRTTVSEFSNILDELYRQGFILIDFDDLTQKKKGKLVKKELYLPQGKTPVIISQEDVSYKSSLSGDGFASKLIIDKNGMPLCEYEDEDGNVTTGEYDLVPVLEKFVREHPDFSYKGARGIIAVTGDEGVLGYNTNPESEAFSDNDVENARKTAERLKELGWEFASNSFSYTSYNGISLDALKSDADRWEKEVEPIVGKTDILVYANGNDIVSTGEYSEENEKYTYLKSLGFDYFCYGDTAQYSITYGEDYFRQGRRILSGFRLTNQADGLIDLFDAGRIVDIARPQ